MNLAESGTFQVNSGLKAEMKLDKSGLSNPVFDEFGRIRHIPGRQWMKSGDEKWVKVDRTTHFLDEFGRIRHIPGRQWMKSGDEKWVKVDQPPTFWMNLAESGTFQVDSGLKAEMKLDKSGLSNPVLDEFGRIRHIPGRQWMKSGDEKWIKVDRTTHFWMNLAESGTFQVDSG
jgi:hypothetical protein